MRVLARIDLSPTVLNRVKLLEIPLSVVLAQRVKPVFLLQMNLCLKPVFVCFRDLYQKPPTKERPCEIGIEPLLAEDNREGLFDTGIEPVQGVIVQNPIHPAIDFSDTIGLVFPAGSPVRSIDKGVDKREQIGRYFRKIHLNLSKFFKRRWNKVKFNFNEKKINQL